MRLSKELLAEIMAMPACMINVCHQIPPFPFCLAVLEGIRSVSIKSPVLIYLTEFNSLIVLTCGARLWKTVTSSMTSRNMSSTISSGDIKLISLFYCVALSSLWHQSSLTHRQNSFHKAKESPLKYSITAVPLSKRKGDRYRQNRYNAVSSEASNWTQERNPRSHRSSRIDHGRSTWYWVNSDSLLFIMLITKFFRYEVARAFVLNGARVIMVNRKEDQGQEAIDKIKEEAGKHAQIEWMPCDMGNFKQIQETFTHLRDREERLDLVLL